MHLLLFINSLGNGGAERVMAKLANHWAASGHQVTLATLTAVATDQYAVTPDVHRVSLEAGKLSAHLFEALYSNLQRWWRLRRLIRSAQPDCLVAFMPTANILGFFACMGLPVRRIISERNHPPNFPMGRVRTSLQRFSYPRADCLVALTETTSLWYEAHLGCRNVTVIPNAIALPLPVNTPVIEPADYVTEEYKLMLSVGRLVDDKQMDHVLNAFAEAADNSWWLAVIGNGPQQASLQSLAQRLGVGDRVIFLPRVGNVEAWYRRADLFVSAATLEGFPNVLLEALACGCPAVAYDCPTGPAEIIQSDENGTLVPLNDLTKFKQAVKTLVNDQARRERYGKSAAQVVRTHSEKRFFAAWDQVLLGSSV
jgi:glycosyltransferase involved in cell wall biosynthesis